MKLKTLQVGIMSGFIIMATSGYAAAKDYSQDYKHPDKYDNLHKKNNTWKNQGAINSKKHNKNKRQINRYKSAGKIMKNNSSSGMTTSK